MAGIAYQLHPGRCFQSKRPFGYAILLRKKEIGKTGVIKLMTILQTTGLMIASTIFGALVTYFFKNIFQGKEIVKIIEESVQSSVKAGFKTHVLIHHKNDPVELIDEKIQVYSKEVDYKLSQRDKEIKILFDNQTISKESLHGIDLSIAGILGELKLLQKGKDASS